MAAVLASTLVSCTGKTEEREGVLVVTPSETVDDEPVHIRVTDLAPGQQIELTATATGLNGAIWSASATFTADGDGVVDLDRDAPISGDYRGVDGMGLIAAMAPGPAPTPTSTPTSSEAPASRSIADRPRDYQITVAMTGGRQVKITRVVIKPDVTVQELTVAEDGVAGVLATPAEPAGAGVLLIGGSEGGVLATATMALMLANHGYPTLAVSYFNSPGLPSELRDIPIEYFVTAANKLPGPVRVVGFSRGSEAALLLSALYPHLVAGTVLGAPAAKINLGFPNGGFAWTYGSTPRLDIPFDAIAGPVLAFAGSKDAVWPAADNIASLAEELGDRLESIVVDGAGHDVLGVPYLGADTEILHPVSGRRIQMGGSRQLNEQARRQTWTALLEFLAETA